MFCSFVSVLVHFYCTTCVLESMLGLFVSITNDVYNQLFNIGKHKRDQYSKLGVSLTRILKIVFFLSFHSRLSIERQSPFKKKMHLYS